MTILTAKEIYNQMVSYMIANQNRITDFNDGTTIDTQFNAIATQINQAFVKCSGGFKSQFAQIPFQAFDFARETATKASCTVVFSAPSAVVAQINIPSGTIVGTSGGLLYTTTETVSILVGHTDSGAAEAEANDYGADYNVQTGIITVLNTTIDGVNAVTNNTAATGGTNRESNSAYFARFQNFILGLSGSNRYGVWTAAVLTPTIQSAYVEDHFPPDSGIYNFTVYVDDGSGSVPIAVLEEVSLNIYGNDTADYQGYAAAGINFKVESAGLVNVAIAYTLEIDTDATDATTVETAVEDAITNYINSLWVGSDVIHSNIIKLIQLINGVVTVTALTLNASSTDLSIAASQVPRVSTITGTIS